MSLWVVVVLLADTRHEIQRMGKKTEGMEHVLSFLFLSSFVVCILPLFNDRLIGSFYLGSCVVLISEQ